MLRNRELAAIRVQVENGFGESALKSLDERGSAEELVRQQYTGRYPFELLQNANDAAQEAAARGRAHFHLTDSSLLIADNGAGFGAEQVEAICSLGRSSKGLGESVGHKGLGFKSVGEIADRPQIVSELASFQFDADWARGAVGELLGPLSVRQRLPTYAFPFSIETSGLGDDEGLIDDVRSRGYGTVIRLPFRAGVDRVTVEEHLLSNLQPRLLLFLPHIDHLELRGTSSDFSSEISRDTDDVVEHALLESEGGAEEWLVYRSSVAPNPSDLKSLGDPWEEIEEIHFAIAVPIDTHGQPLVDETFPLHVYFPTDEHPGLHVAVHAEWVLSMDRRQIATAPEAVPFNRMLTEAVTQHLRLTVGPDLMKRTAASATAVEALVPANSAPQGRGGAALKEMWCEALLETAIFPTAGGSLNRPGGLRLLPRNLPDPEPAHTLADLDEDQSLRPDVERVSSVRAFLAGVAEVYEISIAELLSLLTPPSLDTVLTFYEFLVDWREVVGSRLLVELRSIACVLGPKGQLYCPETDTIFFPREKGEVRVPEDLPVPIAHVPEVEGAQALLRDLGVRSFEWRELIRDYLIKILSDEGSSSDLRERAMAGLRSYHQVRLQGNEDLEPILGRVLLPARTADGRERELRPAAEIYFSSSWSDADELETIYGPFGEAEFLDTVVPEDAEQRRIDYDFYRMLGVVAHPRLDEARPTEAHGYMLASFRHPHRGALFQEWLASAEVESAATCPQGHPQSQQLRVSYRLDRHEKVIESRDPVRLIALWNQLARHWGSVFEVGMEAMFYCVQSNHAGDRARSAPSLFAYTVRSQSWVPVDRGGVAEFVRPSEAWIDATQTPRRIQERIPRISTAMYEVRGGAGLASSLGLIDAGRLRALDLLRLLQEISDEASEVGATSREIDQAARWIQRTLNDVLSDTSVPHPAPDSVKLLASENGVTKFVSQPPFADDHLLRDTFEKQRPILSADVGLRRLASYLSLVRLDDAVITLALPLGDVADEVYRRIRSHIDHVMPYLLALVRTENSSAESRVQLALRNLEVILCERLVLEYKYEGAAVTRDDATCFIASRLERRGRRRLNVLTAYLELDAETGVPHWFSFGRQLAQHVGVPMLADAFTMFLTASPDDRQRMLADRLIQPQDVIDARQALRVAGAEDEELENVLDSILPRTTTASGANSLGESVASRDGDFGDSAATYTETGSAIDEANGDGLQPSGDGAGRTTAPPPVDFSSVEIVDANPGVAPRSHRSVVATGYGGIAGLPNIQTDEENRRVGKRGEEVAYNAERERLRRLGRSPSAVRWVSNFDPLSPFDLTSVDDDNQLIYIEVKATRGRDPSEGFYISASELIEASARRGRYYIYRVTDVDSASPKITRWADPLQLIREGKGTLLLAKAQMALTLQEAQPTSTGSLDPGEAHDVGESYAEDVGDEARDSLT